MRIARADAYISKTLEPGQFAAAIAALCGRAQTSRTELPPDSSAVPRTLRLLGSDGQNMCDLGAVATLFREQEEGVGPVMARLRAEIAKQTLAACGGNASAAARTLKLSRRTFGRWLSGKSVS